MHPHTAALAAHAHKVTRLQGQIAALGIHVSPGFAALILVLFVLLIIGSALRFTGSLSGSAHQQSRRNG